MSASYLTKLILAFHNGDGCAMPNCNKCLTAEGEDSNSVVTGEAAHIAGEKKIAPRYDSSMTDEQRNNDSNLIYLCGSCHNRIDKQVGDFPVQRLHAIKTEHEKRVREAMLEAFTDVGFPELEEATKWIACIPPSSVTHDFSLIPLEDKLRKNELSNTSRSIITMGLSVASEVHSYVENVSQTDSGFPERLKAGFLKEYYGLKQKGLLGDELFELMCLFAQRGFKNQSQRSAGLAVLIYLFEACEVFEK